MQKRRKELKVRSLGSQFASLLVSLILIVSLAPFVIAPSHPVELVLDKEGNVIGTTDIATGITEYHETTYTLSAGMTPDSPFYFIDTFFDTFASPEDVAAEKLGEMQVMIEEGNYEEAGVAAGHAQTAIEEVQTIVEQADTVGEVVEEEVLVLSYDQVVEDLKETLVTAVDAGTITEEQAAATGIDEVQEQVVEFADTVDEQKDEVIETIAADTGQTSLEAEVEVLGAAEEAAGVSEVHENEVEAELPAAQIAVEQIEAEFEAALAAGTEFPNEAAISQLIDEASVQLESCENAFEHERDGEAFGRLTAAEALINNVEQLIEVVEFTDEAEREEVLAELSDIQAEREAEEAERIDEASDFVADYEQVGDEFADKHPELAEDYDDYKEQMEKVMALAEKLSTEYQSEYDKLVAEGSSEEEATAVLSDRFAQEYLNAYGEPYIPPGTFFNDVPGEGLVPADPGLAAAGGGFVEGFVYEDPASGYKYEMLADGWRYTTPLGEVYDQNFPEGYTPPKAYTEGNEIHSYKVETPEGTVEYTYTATGYEVVNPDGTKETFAYPEGDYTFSGGGGCSIKPTGFEITTEEGGQTKEVKYDYNPEFNTYVSSTGTVFAAYDASLHSNYIQYQGDTNQYSYSYSGATWNYDPATSSWSSSTGETYKPEATTVAPVGYESTGTYTTYTGETWNYDSSTNSWTSSTGESHTGYTAGEPSSYTYSYDTSTGSYSYTDPSTGQTTTYSGTYESGGTYTGTESGGYTAPSGDTGGSPAPSGGGDGGGGGMGHVIRIIRRF